MRHTVAFASLLTLLVWLIVQKIKLLRNQQTRWKSPDEIRGENQRIRQSAAMKAWRLKVLKRDNFTCQKCGAKGYLEAHHIKPFAYFPALRFDINNGQTLCKSCHMKTDSYGSKAKLNYGKH